MDSQIISALIFPVFLISSFYSSVQSINNINQNHQLDDESIKLNYIRDYLKQINKPYVKTIKSLDGDIIDCVSIHQQPAFDHPLLKGQKIIKHPPENLKGHTSKTDNFEENFQVWSMSGESCPEKTIPIRRTTEQDVLRAKSVQTFGRKIVRAGIFGNSHEHAIGSVNGEYYGAQATVNVWGPQIEAVDEFSVSQIWVLAGSFDSDLNSIEVGWMVDPTLYGDTYTRLFIYWTSDGYQTTGCYNLLCSGFVQTNQKLLIGTAIQPTSSYNGSQFDIPFYVYKNQTDGNWWLQVKDYIVGYWPSILFTHLGNESASLIEFGGEIVNSESSGTHTSTQMGSGHFADEGFGKASYFRNIQVVDENYNLVNVTDIELTIESPNCYNITKGEWLSHVWGYFFFYGGPGRGAPGCN
ncbi:hypothetical protein CASFOL_009683 [Castilleja foliolosa]|uniref:Neprosin PEP catalytic domain-containing protein n=1 Tax=Castilleja foliolosa TaxID=1961234 RepID=A0ABD3DQC8_9LAMI